MAVHTHTKQMQEYHPEISQYVPAMDYAGDISIGSICEVEFGVASVSAAGDILSTQSLTTAVTIQRASLLSYRSTARFGRNVIAQCDGTATSTVDIYSRDYWGQPVRETLTLTSTTQVVGLKSHFVIDRVVLGATNGINLNLGWGTRFGLPYKTTAVLKETADGVTATAGTLTAPVLTDPQTATTGDPRGQYAPTTTPDAVKSISIVCIVDNGVNAAGNGGLMGIAHKGS